MARWSGGGGIGGGGDVDPGAFRCGDLVPELGLGPFRQQGLIKVSDWLPALLVDETSRRFAFIGRWNLQHRGKKKKKKKSDEVIFFMSAKERKDSEKVPQLFFLQFFFYVSPFICSETWQGPDRAHPRLRPSVPSQPPDREEK